VVVPAKTHLRIIVTSADVLHSWAVPSLGVKCDAVPGRLNQISILVQREGVYYGQCSEICGTNHAFMPIVVEAVSRKNYASWVSNQLMPTKKEGAEAILIASPHEGPPYRSPSYSSSQTDDSFGIGVLLEPFPAEQATSSAAWSGSWIEKWLNQEVAPNEGGHEATSRVMEQGRPSQNPTIGEGDVPPIPAPEGERAVLKAEIERSVEKGLRAYCNRPSVAKRFPLTLDFSSLAKRLAHEELDVDVTPIEELRGLRGYVKSIQRIKGIFDELLESLNEKKK